jgi:hypothetical protein
MSKAIILMYHNIDIPPKGARIPNLYVTPRMFRYQLWHLKAAGFKVLSVQYLLAAVATGDMMHNMAAITFDDIIPQVLIVFSRSSCFFRIASSCL